MTYAPPEITAGPTDLTVDEGASATFEVAATGDIRVLPLGQILLRHVAMAFDAYLDPQLESGERTFSQTV